MNESEKRDAFLVLSLFLFLWGILLVFENAYFSAAFFGVPIPAWAAWIGSIPNPQLSLTVIDTVAVIAVAILAFVLRPPSPRRTKLRASSRGGVGAAIFWLVAIVLLIVVLVGLGLNLSTIIQDVRSFFSGL